MNRDDLFATLVAWIAVVVVGQSRLREDKKAILALGVVIVWVLFLLMEW